jgi:CRISPR-associated endonuclease/helicase Cas3
MLLPGAARLGLDRRILGLLTTLHDIGKISRSFQAQAPEHWPASLLGRLTDPVPGFPHDAMGLHLLTGPLQNQFDSIVPPDRYGGRGWTSPLMAALAGHHGRPAALNRLPDTEELDPACEAAARVFVDAMMATFRPPALPMPQSDREILRLSWHLAGLITLADWIGSRQRWFPYVTRDAVADPGAYLWNRALPQAAVALAAAGLGSAPAAPFSGLRRLFPGIERPTPIQTWAETVDLPLGPVLAVIEDLTGSGKTEAAMTLAHRLLAQGRAEGVFLALPTMATANAMFGRLVEAYHRLFSAEARPSLALAHGRAVLDPRFRAAVAPDDVDDRRRPCNAEPDQEPSEAHCAAWLAEEGRRALLAQMGIGTIDQALLSVLPVRHAALRQQGLSGKVLIVDEAHAFDPYMQRELVELLRFHAALGGSAVLLSATLPRKVRKTLVDAFLDGLGARRAPLARHDYPLATLVSAAGLSETLCAPREGLPRTVSVTRVTDEAAALERIVAAAEAGAAVAWVRNTVDDAIAAAAALRECGVEPLLFHARFAMADRLAIEREVMRRFGKAPCADRPGVLVATQVVEQSLDLDFDLLVTDLAPADLLIQRAGRLWRHARDARPVPGPEMVVVSPEPVEDPPADWVRLTVYRDPALLWRTAREVFRRGAITTPGDLREIIEAVAEGEVPRAMARAAEQAEGKAVSARGIAAQNVLKFRDGYRRDAGLWERDTRTPTRLEERPQVVLRLAVERDGKVVPYAEDPDPDRSWALSEVSVAADRVTTCLVPAGLEAAAEAARAGWGRWERESPRHLLAVMDGHGAMRAMGGREGGETVSLIYSRVAGLTLPRPH